MDALGCHVFAGGFTMGVSQEMNILGQLEVHNFGRETAESFGIDFINRDSAKDWPRDIRIKPCFLYGNPRCTGFSCVTTGQSSHGAFAEPTRDAVEFVNYATEMNVPVFAWESVQQAYTVGKPLLERFVNELCEPRGYRVAHLMLNASSFGNAQNRRRYFFVGYKKGLIFNVEAPDISQPRATMKSIIGHLSDRDTNARRISASEEYGPDSFYDLCDDEWRVVHHLTPRDNLNQYAKKYEMELLDLSPKYYDIWMTRTSSSPFSFHSMFRTAWNWSSPTLYGSALRKIIHPLHDRPLTIRELSLVMGWPIIPVGHKPAEQMAKGIVPAIGKWLAQQVKLCLNNHWGN